MFEFPESALGIRESWVYAQKLWLFLVPKIQWLAVIAILWAVLPYFLIAELNTHHVQITGSALMERIPAVVVHMIVLMFLYSAIYHVAKFAINGERSNYWQIALLSAKSLVMLIPAVILSVAVTFGGFLLLIIPGFYVLLVLTFYYPLIILDDLNFWTALQRVFKLVQKNWWYTFGVLGIPMLAFLAVNMFVEYCTIGFYWDNFILPVASLKMWFFHHIIKIILGAWFFPLFVALTITHLHNLKVRYAQLIQDEPESESEVIINGL